MFFSISNVIPDVNNSTIYFVLTNAYYSLKQNIKNMNIIEIFNLIELNNCMDNYYFKFLKTNNEINNYSNIFT